MTRTEHAKYTQNPVREALVVFFFRGPREQLFDPTLPGLFLSHASIQSAYPKRPKPQPQRMRVGVMELQLSTELDPLRFEAEDGRHLLLLRPGMLSVHAVGDYQGWADFRPRVLEALDAYTTQTGLREVERVSVRYINAWPLTRDEQVGDFMCGVGDMTCLAPRLGARMLAQRHEYGTSEQGFVVVNQGWAPVGEDTWEASLDIEAGKDTSTLRVEELTESIDALQEEVYATFEALVKERAKERFR